MFSLTESHRFFVFSKPTDMRKSFDALCGIVRIWLCRNPLSGDVFVFINRKRNMMKLLHWQQGGLMLYFKRLEKGTFEIPENKGNELEISHTELSMIIAGISVGNIQKRKRFRKSKKMI